MTIDLAALRASVQAMPGTRVSIDKADLLLVISHAQAVGREQRMCAAIAGATGTGGVSAPIG